MKYFFAAILFFTSFAINAAKQWQDFAHLPIIQRPSVSPDGQQIAMLYNTAAGPTVAIAPFATKEFKVLAGLKKNRDRLDFIRWSGNHILIVGTSYPEKANGQHFRVRRLFSVDTRNTQTRLLTTRLFERNPWFRYQSFNLVSVLKNDPEHALVSTYDTRDEAVAVFKVNLLSGTFDKVQQNQFEIDSWYADLDGVVRVGTQFEKKDGTFYRHFWYRETKDDALVKIHTRESGKKETFNIIGFHPSNTKLYVLSDKDTGFESLWLYDISTGEFEERLFQAPGYDVSDGLFDPQGDLIGVYYYDDFIRTHYFDKADGATEQALANMLPGLQVSITSQSEDKNRMLLLASSDNQVPVFYWFDARQQSGGAWMALYPHLLGHAYDPVTNISVTASDGQQLQGYLTLPAGVEAPKLVVMPHGGPQARDYKDFDPMVQFLANKGYAVLQVNFRGSTGFGSAFETAGYYQWGKRMQQDVYDAMDWAIKSGKVSQDRACALGFSYGGYWSMTASVQQPDRFDCVISVSGISDLYTMIKDRERNGYYSGNVIDDDNPDAIDANIEALKAVSAINFLDKLHAPVLLIHGDNDTRVHFEQSQWFKENAPEGKTVNYIRIKDGTHFFDDVESKQVLYREIGAFLEQHL